jgi:hypothetical protein
LGQFLDGCACFSRQPQRDAARVWAHLRIAFAQVRAILQAGFAVLVGP